MEQFNRNNYKKQNFMEQFFHSCLGKMVIFVVIVLALLVVAIITVPSKDVMMTEMEDNIRECVQDNDSIRGDAIDAFIDNFCNIFTEADTTFNDREVMKAYRKYNKLAVYDHTLFRTALLHSGMHPEGIRVGFGLFGVVIPTVAYSDLVLTIGPVRGNYNEKLLDDVGSQPDDYVGDNPNIKPYHYQGNPDD